MFDGNELIFGIGSIIIGLVLLFLTIKDRIDSGKDELWGGSMFLQGIVAGLAFLIIGVLVLIRSIWSFQNLTFRYYYMIKKRNITISFLVVPFFSLSGISNTYSQKYYERIYVH